jgi:hypothetical protein
MQKLLCDPVFCMGLKLDLYIKGRTQIEDISEWDAEKNICTQGE